MRPILNANIPQINGANKTFTTYQEWREELVASYGQHCVYCNDRLQSNLQVEHLAAQSLNTISPLVWNNLFLACGPCNLAKSAKIISNTIHYLPNEHNTHFIFEYQTRKNRKNGKYACIPVPSLILNANQRIKAINTITLTELNRIEQTPLRQRKMTDVRWLNRYNAFQVAAAQRNIWNTLTSQNQIAAYLLAIPPLIESTGFFSLWLIAFNNVPDVLQVLIDTLPNTDRSCFDATLNPIPRNPNNIIDPI